MSQNFYNKLIAVLLICSLVFSQTILNVQARELSKAGQIFEHVKNGVVTVLGSGHGSGFLMDKSGLIVTNSHVISQSGDDIQIRFGANQVIEGKVIENDNNADIAIILVNLKNIKDYTVLKPFIPTINEPLVLIGEQILAVGSPIEWETLEKTLTSGVVGKYEGNLIYHDASINQGNSGGPLFNYDGDVVGVNTFVESAAGQAIGGSVSINKVMPIFERARQKLGLIPMPSENLLPDIPNTPYPIDRLLEQGIEGFPRRDSKDYMVDSKYFTVEFRTPPQGYKEFLEQEQELLKNRQKRAEHHGFEIKDDELHSKNLAKFYNYSKPIVTVIVKPKPQLTNGSKALNTLMLYCCFDVSCWFSIFWSSIFTNLYIIFKYSQV
ncbi:MAG: hypothetical protein A2104_06355 [Candidatus Melainabacteria bacterium GWF2_32_7]|nr:MAG: hypothetical protein A2104_06355 [Candidatus Melainabacteria bacterium GWF2_32_7]